MYEFGVMAYDVAIIRCIVAALERYMSNPWLIEKIQILVWHKHLHCSLIDDLTSPLASGMDSIAGTYCGVLPPDVETTLTLNADGTYLLIQTFKEKQNEQERLRGTFQVLDYNILMLVHPSSGEHTFYKVKDANFIVLTDSVGNEPEGETAKFYVLKKVKNMRLIKNVDSNFATHVFYKS